MESASLTEAEIQYLIAEYLSDRTGALFTGIDYIPEAISLARQRTQDKAKRLDFLEMDLDEIDFPPASFDAITSIDTLYFVDSMEKTIGRLKELLRSGGRLAVYFSPGRAIPGRSACSRRRRPAWDTP